MLHYNTVSTELLDIIKAIASNDDFNNFRLCGGTGLALQKGHRISVDADFVAQEILSADELIGKVLRNFSTVTDIHTGKHGVFCKIGNIKTDFLTWSIPFIRNEIVIDQIKLTDVEEIIAMKLFAILQRGEKKDYMDVASMLSDYSLHQMIGFYKERHKGSDDLIVLRFLAGYTDIEKQPDPKMLNGLTWLQCKNILLQAVKEYLT